ncbi:conoporin-Cn1-like [Mytilus galloprovincialis]|uniref:conoporin-Cn1-like n=1 Tax=Mytilus galloprovincialis TaxID=29158 RepID=UPI003F7BA6F6
MENDSSCEHLENEINKGRVDWNKFGKTLQKSLTLGQTLKGNDLQSLMRSHTSITCGIAIENWTNSELSSPQYASCTGMLSIPPRSIGSGTVQAVVSHKSSFGIRGCSGLISWKLENRRVVMAWTIPYFTSNALTVGITNNSCAIHDDKWFRKMMEDKSDNEITFTKEVYQNGKSCKECKVESSDGKYEVLATMGTSGRSEINVIVRGTTFDNCHKSIRLVRL